MDEHVAERRLNPSIVAPRRRDCVWFGNRGLKPTATFDCRSAANTPLPRTTGRLGWPSLNEAGCRRHKKLKREADVRIDASTRIEFLSEISNTSHTACRDGKLCHPRWVKIGLFHDSAIHIENLTRPVATVATPSVYVPDASVLTLATSLPVAGQRLMKESGLNESDVF